MVKIAIIQYSLYGHVTTMAESIKQGVLETDSSIDCTIYSVPETLPSDVLEKMYAPPKDYDTYPIITKDELTQFDGFIFGISGRFGSINAQMRAFLDSTGQLWQTGALVGKPAGVFFSTAVQGGGQETIALTMVPFFVSHGMVYVPLGYTHPGFQNMDELHGGSPYGAGTYAKGDGSRQPSDLEKEIAVTQGKNFAVIASKLCKVEL